MRTYTCDRCGFEAHDKSGIVGREFERQGFETLTKDFRWPGVVDVCGSCFKRVKLASDEADEEVKDARRRRFLARMGL